MADLCFAKWTDEPEMGQRTKGDMWCEVCGVPTLGVKTTARARNTVSALALPATLGLSAVGFKNDGYVCQNCGAPVVHIPGLSRRFYEYTARQELEEQLAIERSEYEDRPQHLDTEDDWRTIPAHQLPPWRVADRARLDADRALIGDAHQTDAQSDEQADGQRSVAEQLSQLADLRAMGALSDQEFARAKAKVLE